jgi:hypothetical protein
MYPYTIYVHFVNAGLKLVQGNCMRNKRDDKWSDF